MNQLRLHYRRLQDARISLHGRVMTALEGPTVVAWLLAPSCVYASLALELRGVAATALSWTQTGVMVFFLVRELLRVIFARGRDDLRPHRGTLGAALLALVAMLLAAALDPVTPLERFFVQWMPTLLPDLVLAVLIVEGQLALMHYVTGRLRLAPPVFIAGSFAAVIALGTALLLSPHAVPEGAPPLGLLDAIFTATSATCVTGLVVRDTGTELTLYGQLVVLGMIQVGGLGLVTLVSFFSLASSGGLAIKERLVLGNALNTEETGQLGRTLIFVLLTTLAIEATGAAALGLLLSPSPGSAAAGDGVAARIYDGVFHSISAFCNAGFSLDGRSLTPYASRPAVQLVTMGLIVIGGLGFVIVIELRNMLRRRLAHRGFLRRQGAAPLTTLSRLTRGRAFWPEGGHVASTQLRVVLVTTALLLGLAFVSTALLEWNGESMRGLGAGDKLVNSLFHSVTLRTAGFNTVALEQMSTATLYLSTIFMFIGASPGSTGGGIKTTTIAICILAIGAIFRGREDVEVGGRRIPERLVRQCLVIAAIQASLVFTITLVLAIAHPDIAFGKLLFEAVSATGTVGLSAGVTSSLGVAGKIAIIVGMFCGRIGPLTLVLALAARRARHIDYRYPEARVMIG